jgi:hypothetical protein
MKRRPLLLVLSIGVFVTLGLATPSNKPGLLLLDWMKHATPGPEEVAVLLEMGLEDHEPTSWAGKAAVQGGRVVRREGYRFHAGDHLTAPDGWKAGSHWPAGQALPRAARGRPAGPRMLSVGVVLHLADLQPGATLHIEAAGHPEAKVPLRPVIAGQAHPLWGGKAVVRRLSLALPVAAERTEDDFPAAAFAPDGGLWVAYIGYHLKDESRRRPHMQLRQEPADFRAYYTPGFGDQLFVKHFRSGRWSRPLAVTGPAEDLVRCAIAVEGNGHVWVVYSANRQGNYDLYARRLVLPPAPAESPDTAAVVGAEERLTHNPGPDLTPVACTDQQGRVHVAYQAWSEDGTARIALLQCQNGKCTPGPQVLPSPVSGGEGKGEGDRGNHWYPALAAGPNGELAVGYDVYAGGDYDVHVAVVRGGHVQDYPVATSSRFEARPALAYGPLGRLWIAYEEGPELWGKNFGALETDRGNPLYNMRSVRVVCLADGRLQRPAANLPVSASPDREPRPGTPRYAYPRLGIDGRGRLWLAYRQKLPTVFGTQPGSYWLSYARRLDGDHWTEPVELHHSDGLLDSRPVLLPHPSGGLLVVGNTDGRYADPESFANHIYTSVVGWPGEPQPVQLVALEAVPEKNRSDAEERAGVERVRRYQLAAAGKTYHIRRGDFHRHTEISFDGGDDGSLEDFFRYAIDAAALDWVGNTDHDSGAGREYSWWLIQKYSDAYHIGKAFTPVFAYERSVAYPLGHRNCLFARRGVRTLPRLFEPDPKKRLVASFGAGDTPMLYRYLKEMDGICAAHTSATNMGTDWRDNDRAVEPVVEIYQGDRNSYEKEGAPRAGYPARSGKRPVNIAGWFPKGYINLALEKGYRLGFQASSDHISTHISYCVVLTEQDSRQGIVDALRRRHSYGATDDILLEVRSGEHIMGDEFQIGAAPHLSIRAVGVKSLERVHILKDSDIVATFQPGHQEFVRDWADPQPARGMHYYYVRIEQSDGELAWSSPLWMDYRP